MSDAGRVIAGSAAGRRLLAPGAGTRPFADRVKQTLFAILEPDLPGSVALDMFAGSGAAGIEALSRGAARAVFVERDPGAIRVIRENLARAGFAKGADVVQADAIAWLRTQAAGRGPYDIVIVDPPYDQHGLLLAALAILGDGTATLLSAGARVVAKHFWRDAPPAQVGLLASERGRRFGETALTFYRVAPADAAGTPKGEP